MFSLPGHIFTHLDFLRVSVLFWVWHLFPVFLCLLAILFQDHFTIAVLITGRILYVNPIDIQIDNGWEKNSHDSQQKSMNFLT